MFLCTGGVQTHHAVPGGHFLGGFDTCIHNALLIKRNLCLFVLVISFSFYPANAFLLVYSKYQEFWQLPPQSCNQQDIEDTESSITSPDFLVLALYRQPLPLILTHRNTDLFFVVFLFWNILINGSIQCVCSLTSESFESGFFHWDQSQMLSGECQWFVSSSWWAVFHCIAYTIVCLSTHSLKDVWVSGSWHL